MDTPLWTATESYVADSDDAAGAVECQVRADIAELGELTGTRRSTAEICYALARYLDDLMGKPGTGGPAPVARELATRLNELAMTATDRQEVSEIDRIVAEVADELAEARQRRTDAAAGA